MIQERWSYLSSYGFSCHCRPKAGKYWAFRVHGDGVFQVLDIEKCCLARKLVIHVGLFSLYGLMREEWFSSQGYITHEDVVRLSGRKQAYDYMIFQNSEGRDYMVPDFMSIEQQLDYLYQEGLPYLEQCNSQKSLITALDALDLNKPIWLNDRRLFAYIAMGDWLHAEMSVTASLMQHRIPLNPITDVPVEDRDSYLRQIDIYRQMTEREPRDKPNMYDDWEQELLIFLEQIRIQNEDWRTPFLRKNYETNIAYCMKHRIIS